VNISQLKLRSEIFDYDDDDDDGDDDDNNNKYEYNKTRQVYSSQCDQFIIGNH